MNNFYASDLFKAKAAEHSSFLNELQPYLDGRSVSLQNMVDTFSPF